MLRPQYPRGTEWLGGQTRREQGQVAKVPSTSVVSPLSRITYRAKIALKRDLVGIAFQPCKDADSLTGWHRDVPLPNASNHVI